MTLPVAQMLRYMAYAGQIESPAAAAQRQAKADRQAYGGAYRANEDRLFAQRLLALRFLNEVCGVPLGPARQYIFLTIRSCGEYQFGVMPRADRLAARFAADNGSAFMGEAAASLYHAAARHTPWERLWLDVLERLRSGAYRAGRSRPAGLRFVT